MDRRVAQGDPSLSQPDVPVGNDADVVRAESGVSSTFVSIVLGACLIAIALVVYTASHPYRFYNHFEWQAAAFLEGHAAIRYPVEATATSPGNSFFQDVLPVAATDGVPRALVPFPPLPAVVLVPFVALWGLNADGQLVFAVLAALDVGLAWWVLGMLPIRIWVRFAATIFFGFGTVFWYTAQIGTTWYQAHVLAIALALAAVGIAIRGDRRAALDEDDPVDGDPIAGAAVADGLPGADEAARAATGAGVAGARLGGAGIDGAGPGGAGVAAAGVAARESSAARSVQATADRPWFMPNRWQLLAGLLFGLACTSRLTVVFAAPFFLLVGPGGSWLRRGWSAGLGAAIPLAALGVYNLATTGSLLHPGYQHLYELEASFYTPLNYHLEWSIEDLRYVPQNFAIMFLNTPVWLPDVIPAALGNGSALCTTPEAVRGWFNPDCPLLLPRDTGMSVLLTSPAYLLILPALRWGYGHSRLVTGAALAVFLIAMINLMHFSQGWVQFGYRFSNDFVPWALLLVAIGLERVVAWAGARRARWPVTATVALTGAALLVVLSVVVNFWGVVWGDALGW